MVKDKMMNGYYFLDSAQISNLLQLLKTSKNTQDKDLFNSLSYQVKNYKTDNNYREAAIDKLTKIDSFAVTNEELLVDSDAVVSFDRTGAYVQCWLWVDNEAKLKKTRKKVVKDAKN
jgi:uncharacterized protein YpbB